MNTLLSMAQSRPAWRNALGAFAIFTIIVTGSAARAQDNTAPGNNLELERVLPIPPDSPPDQPGVAPVAPDVTPTQQDMTSVPPDGTTIQPDGTTTAGQPGGGPDLQDLSADNSMPAEASQDDSDPLAPFNEKMFTFNLKLDEWLLRPVASGYAAVAPKPVRQSVGRFFENVGVIPRFANNLFQLRFSEAGGEVARFGINSTLGIVGLFDPAESWFGLKQHDDDFGLTLRYYGAPTGPYVMLPGLGPSTVVDTIGMAVDHAMNPMSYLLPWPWYIEIPVGFAKRALETINYRSLRMDQFESADRYAVDLYGAVQDAYLQTRGIL